MLKVVPIDWIYPFEWTDPHLSVDSESSIPDLIRDPFLVVQTAPEQYLLLEGTDVYGSLAKSSLPVLPVQVANSEMFDLLTTSIACCRFTHADFIHFVARHPNQIEIASGGQPLKTDSSFLTGTIVFDDNRELKVAFRNSSRAGCPTPLAALFAELESAGRYFQADDDQPESGSVTGHLPVSGKLTLTDFELTELTSAALTDQLFPPHLIRINCRRRILGIDFPTRILLSELPIEEKESFLKDLIALRRQCHRTSVYTGEVYLLNR